MISPLWEVPVAISHIFSFTVYARAWWSAFMHPLTVWLSEKRGGWVYTTSDCSGFYTCKQWIWKWHMNSYYTLVSMCKYFDRKLQHSSGKWNQHHHRDPHRDTDRNICEPMRLTERDKCIEFRDNLHCTSKQYNTSHAYRYILYSIVYMCKYMCEYWLYEQNGRSHCLCFGDAGIWTIFLKLLRVM